MKDRLTFRPGTLAGPLAAWCESNGATPSDAIRVALSLMLNVPPPSMPVGRPPAKQPSRRSDSRIAEQ